MSELIPVLEVGGTHVSAALVDPDGWRVSGAVRLPLDAHASADDLLEHFVSAAREVRTRVAGARWGVAMPDPFDYPVGVALFEGVGKFASLYGVDVGARLRAALSADVAFLNDADAFTLGERTAGVGRDADRLVGLTLGTGVGSGWLIDGGIVDPGYPPGGRIHRVDVGGEPLEDLVSRRAILRAWGEAGGNADDDVREICGRARNGDERARGVLRRAFGVLGAALGACLVDFQADLVVVGGSMAASWDLLEGYVRGGARSTTWPAIRISGDAEHSGFVGAAVHATR